MTTSRRNISQSYCLHKLMAIPATLMTHAPLSFLYHYLWVFTNYHVWYVRNPHTLDPRAGMAMGGTPHIKSWSR